MLQAEVGSARITEQQQYPTPGHLMRNFTLPSTDGKQMSLQDFRGHSNLILIFAGDIDQIKEAVSGLVRRYDEIRAQDTEVLLVLGCARERAERVKHHAKLPFPVLADEDMQILKSVGAFDAQARSIAALYMTDRFLEVFAGWRTGNGGGLPTEAQVLSWLDYINSQCPECTQVEWPKED